MRLVRLILPAALLAALLGSAAEAAPQASRGEWWEAAMSSSASSSSSRSSRSSRAARDDDDDDRRSRRSSRGSRSSRSSDDGERYSSGSSSGVGPRPSNWCGWYMRTRHGGGPEMNLAWNWSRYGSAASPQVGAIVVWRHHVGEIVGRASNGQWLVLSGNWGGRVATHASNLSGAVVRM